MNEEFSKLKKINEIINIAECSLQVNMIKFEIFFLRSDALIDEVINEGKKVLHAVRSNYDNHSNSLSSK